MAVIQNIINTVFNTSGDRDAENAANRLGRAQTRLGQSSAAAGRSFAAQSQGLGGLVGAYAGAAATTFALSAAFDALARSARAAQTLEGLTAIAAGSAIAGQELLASVKEITKGQLSLVEAAEQVNLSLSAGFDTTQIEGLAQVSLQASRALGRDLSDSFTRVVRGSAKLETELLDELGIYTKIAPATQAYAASIGTTASKLTEFQRRQAFVNSVIAEGTRKFSSINTTIPSSAEKIEAFAKTISDLITKIGVFIADSVAPLAEFLTDNLAGSLAVLGIAGSLVFGKLFSELNNVAKNFQAKSTLISAAIQDKIINKLGKATREAAALGQQTAKTLDLRPDALSGASRSELSALRTTANARSLSNQELARANTLLQQRAQLLTGKRAALAQEIKDQRAIARSTAATTAERAAANQQLSVLRNKLARLQSVTRANTAAMNALTAATTGARVGFAKLTASALAGLAAIGAGLARLVTGFITFSSLALGFVSIVGLLTAGIFSLTGRSEELNAFLKEAGSFFKALSGQAERIKNRKVFQGLVGGALSELEKANAELRNTDSFTFKKKVLFLEVEIEKTKEEVVSDVSKLLTEISTGSLQTSGERAGTVLGTALAGGITSAIAGSFAGLPTAVGGFIVGAVASGAGALIATAGRQEIGEADTAYQNVLTKFESSLASITNEATRKNITQALAQYEQQYSELARISPDARALLDLTQQLVLKSAKFADNVSEIARITKATGESSDAIAANYSDFESSIEGIQTTITEIGGIEIPISLITEDLAEQTRLFGQDAVVTIENVLRTLNADKTYFRDILDLQKVASNVAASDEPVKMLAKELSISEEAASKLNQKVLAMGLSFRALATQDENLLARIFIKIPESAQKTADAIARNNLVLRNLRDGVDGNTLSFEQFEQSISAAQAGITSLTIETATLGTEFSKALNDPKATPEYVAALKKAYNDAKLALRAQQQILSVLEEQTTQYKAQAAILDLIKSLDVEEIPTLEFELALNSAGLEEPLLAKIAYINNALMSLQSQTSEYNLAVEAASGLPEAGRLLVPTRPLETADDAEDLASALNTLYDGKGILAKANGTTVSYINLLNGATGSLTNLSREAINAGEATGKLKDALRNTAKEGFIATTKAIREQIASLADLTKENNKAVKEIEKETSNIKFQATLDRSLFLRDFKELKAAIALENIELQLDLVKARADSGSLDPFQAVIKENAIQQKILDQRESLITLERSNALSSLADQRAQATKEKADELAAIKAKKDADIAGAEKIRDNLIAQANIYRTFLGGLAAGTQQLSSAITSAGQAFVDAITETFDKVNTALTQAILAGYEKGVAPGSISNTQVNTPAMDVSIADATFNELQAQLNKSTQTYVDSVNARASAEENQAIARADSAISNINNETTRVLEESRAARDALSQERTIESEAAVGRLMSAIESKLSDSVQQAAQDLNMLKGIVKDAEQTIADIADQEVIAKLQFELDMATLDQELAIAKEQIALKQLELQVQLVQAKVGSKSLGAVEGAQQENALQQQILDRRAAILQLELDAIDNNLTRQIDIINQQRQLDIKAAIADANNTTREIQAAKNNATNLINIFRSNILAQQDVNQSLVSGIVDAGSKFTKALKITFESAARAINQAIVAGKEGESAAPTVTAASLDPVTIAEANDKFTSVVNTVTNTADAAEIAVGEALGAQLTAINTAADRAIQLENDRADIAKTNKQAEIDNQTILGEIEAENAKKRLADAQDSGGKSSAEKAADAMKEKLNAIFDGIASSINTAITDFGNLLLYGPGEGETFGDKFRSIFSNLFKSIQQTLFQETIAKPASNFITEKLLGISKTGIENAKFDERGNLKVTVANWLAASVPGLKGSPKGDKEGATVDKIFDAVTGEDGIFGGIKKLFSSIFGEGGFFSNIITSITTLFSGGAEGGGVLSAIFKGIASIFGFASGGTVHRAGGGAIPSVNTRDRVSALLEPGEFVIRKPMARQIGTPALQQLNATGQMSSGNIQVNVTNEGAPKDAQASAPRFDGEKYVIDIVTRDLANNGPIRRSLRGDR